MRTNYSVTIKSCARETELTAKEKIRIKDFTSFPLAEELLKRSDPVKPVNIITLEVHNESSENTDYAVYVIVTTDGMYYTSSESLAESLSDILTEYEQLESEGEWGILVKEFKSKNNTGSFYKAVLV